MSYSHLFLSPPSPSHPCHYLSLYFFLFSHSSWPPCPCLCSVLSPHLLNPMSLLLSVVLSPPLLHLHVLASLCSSFSPPTLLHLHVLASLCSSLSPPTLLHLHVLASLCSSLSTPTLLHPHVLASLCSSLSHSPLPPCPCLSL